MLAVAIPPLPLQIECHGSSLELSMKDDIGEVLKSARRCWLDCPPFPPREDVAVE